MHPVLDVARRPVIAHRGNRAHAPENTLEAFAQAVALGADALEFDVHLAADGVPVVHHDATLERTTAGAGALRLRTSAELAATDAGARFTADGGRSFPYRERGIGVPTLDAVLARFPDTPLLIEIKVPAAAPAVRAALERHGAEARTVVDAFDGAALAPFRGSRIAIGSSRGDVARLLATTTAALRPRAVPYRAVCVPLGYYGIPLPVARFAAALRPLAVPVHVWTVNDPTVATSLWAAGVSGIVTDDPGLMLRTRAAYERGSA
ncbi:glycerophosphodiester phosphodiesterase family protein [Roseisolibacter sp. H3M3-2]|uniref:glycerophosphodiester phosphodiesterase family protein n=1 Tax=Roseisolibacter sp. H3M3-2 TaxID=3031323 RepID=UPI0023DB4008|nr:glycerophosphodiester phosphodiesterase family protein [Roseisolibacter sp. H3M3-2]MDF1505438.1 glycerophosphodiester phosphodiesterase family protein [Roseisolibacter sp. H3M3-2]